MDKFNDTIRQAKEETMPKATFVDSVMNRVSDSPVPIRHKPRFKYFGLIFSTGIAAAIAIIVVIGFKTYGPQSSYVIARSMDSQTSQIEQDLDHESNSVDLASVQLDSSSFNN